MIELIVWCILGLGGWWWLLRRAPPAGCVSADRWRPGDGITIGLLALYVVFGLFAESDPSKKVTGELLRAESGMYLMIASLVLVRAATRTPMTFFGLVPRNPARVIAIGVACIAMTYPLVLLAEKVAELLKFSASEGDGMVQFLRGPLTVSDRCWAAVLALMIAPITEELVFRGYAYGVIKKYGGRVAATLGSALLFAALHQNLPALPALFLLAVGFALAYEFTGSLWTSIVMHMIFNLVPLIVILFFPEWISKF